MGTWNAHTAIGNILGTIIPSFWADTNDDDPPWGWSMIVPGLITWAVAIVIFLFLVIGTWLIVDEYTQSFSSYP